MQEQLLDHKAVEVGEGTLGVMKIGLCQKGIFADHVHGPDRSIQASVDHFSEGHSCAVGKSNTPGRVELFQRLRSIGLITREMSREAAGITAPLDVILASKRRDA